MCRAVLRDSVDGPVQEDRLVRLAYLGRESNVQKPKDIGNASGRKPQHPWGGAGTSG
jgi:hypothetical protein